MELKKRFTFAEAPHNCIGGSEQQCLPGPAEASGMFADPSKMYNSAGFGEQLSSYSSLRWLSCFRTLYLGCRRSCLRALKAYMVVYSNTLAIPGGPAHWYKGPVQIM